MNERRTIGAIAALGLMGMGAMFPAQITTRMDEDPPTLPDIFYEKWRGAKYERPFQKPLRTGDAKTRKANKTATACRARNRKRVKK